MFAAGSAGADLNTSPPAFAGKWGSAGTGNGQFSRIHAVAANAKGEVYAADCATVDAASGDRVQKFTADGGFLTQFGSTGTGDGQLSCPQGLAVEAGGSILVADCGFAPDRSGLQRFSGDGVFQARFGDVKCPEDVAVNSAGTIFAPERNRDQIVLLDANGTQVGTWGTEGTGDGQFDRPMAVAVDPAGNVYVTDWWNDRIQKLSPSGAFLTKWGSTGSGDGQVSGPAAIAADSAGYVYVADAGNNRIEKFDGSGGFVTKWGSEGTGDGQFQFPDGIAIDAAGNLYVADLGNDRIDKFTYAPQVALGGKRTQKAKSAIAIGVTCNLAGCTASATASISVPGAAKRYKLKSSAIELAANAKGTLKLKLKGKAKKAIKRALADGRKLKGKARVSARGAIGTPVTADRTVKLKSLSR